MTAAHEMPTITMTRTESGGFAVDPSAVTDLEFPVRLD